MNEQTKMVESIQQTIGNVKAQIHDLEVELAKLQIALKRPAVAVQTIQSFGLSRKEVIEKAKNFVLHAEMNNYLQFKGFAVKAQFHVNAEKRTVTCLLIGRGSGRIRNRGIARTAPQDVFNAHIGKAIALQKALGQRLDEDYTFAPQPARIEVGDIVRVNGSSKKYTIASRKYEQDGGIHGRAFSVKEVNFGWIGEKQVTLIDDTKGGIQ